jgi:hypothetical protein
MIGQPTDRAGPAPAIHRDILGLLGKHKWLLGLFSVVASLACAGWLWLISPPYRIDRNSYDRIGPGMTRAEIEAIIGVPRGVYLMKDSYHGGQPRTYGACGAVWEEKVKGASCEPWICDTAVLLVWFGPDGGAIRKAFQGRIPEAPITWWDHVYWRLGLP